MPTPIAARAASGFNDTSIAASLSECPSVSIRIGVLPLPLLTPRSIDGSCTSTEALSGKRFALDKDLLLDWRDMKTVGEKLLSTAEVAGQLGVTRQRVLELITVGRLAAMKVGRAYVIRAADVASLELRSVGRPPSKAAKKGARK